MINDFDVEKIVSFLEPLKSQLPKLYQWKPKLESLSGLNIFSQQELAALNRKSSYECELDLKAKVGKALKDARMIDNRRFAVLCDWIIRDWGGIKTGKNEDDTTRKIEEFLTHTHPSFKRIASTSKIGAFLQPDQFIIYDARVAYSLNWIILSQKAGNRFFPVPEGRNSKMNAFDIEVLIRLHHINQFIPQSKESLKERRYISNLDKKLFIPEEKAYSLLRDLVKKIHVRLWADEPEKHHLLYYTEMLLFSISDTEILVDILNHFERLSKDW